VNIKNLTNLHLAWLHCTSSFFVEVSESARITTSPCSKLIIQRPTPVLFNRLNKAYSEQTKQETSSGRSEMLRILSLLRTGQHWHCASRIPEKPRSSPRFEKRFEMTSCGMVVCSRSEDQVSGLQPKLRFSRVSFENLAKSLAGQSSRSSISK
jgi:hypothetical protein